MVSPIASATSSRPPAPAAHHDPLQADFEHLYGESHFPRQMSWYAAEGPKGRMEAAARWIRENPWISLGAGVAAGLVLALSMRPATRAGVAGARAALGACSRRQGSDRCSEGECTD